VREGDDTRTDVELISAINAGDGSAFEVLYYRYRQWVARLAFRFTCDEAAAQDVVQETFLYVLRKFPGLRLTAAFKTFLYPAVRNLSIAARTKAARYQGSGHDTKAEDERGTDDALLADIPGPGPGPTASGELEELLGPLSEEQREVVMLRFVDGLDLKEIATAMNIPVGTVKSRLHHALATLRASPRTREFFE
jgi:RNA polymerase sigma-70 factor (ECF subfamily)